MSTSGFEAYKFYIALKAHFTSMNYDVFKNNGNVTASRASFEERRDKRLFERLSRQFDNPRDLIQYLVANFAYGNDYSLTDNIVSMGNYRQWIKRKESITYMFNEDCRKIILTAQKNNTKTENIFKFVDSNLPIVLHLLLGSHITIETVVILNSYLDIVSNWSNNLVAESSIMKVIKLEAFVKFDESKIKPIYKNLLLELNHESNT